MLLEHAHEVCDGDAVLLAQRDGDSDPDALDDTETVGEALTESDAEPHALPLRETPDAVMTELGELLREGDKESVPVSDTLAHDELDCETLALAHKDAEVQPDGEPLADTDELAEPQGESEAVPVSEGESDTESVDDAAGELLPARRTRERDGTVEALNELEAQRDKLDDADTEEHLEEDRDAAAERLGLTEPLLLRLNAPDAETPLVVEDGEAAGEADSERLTRALALVHDDTDDDADARALAE